MIRSLACCEDSINIYIHSRYSVWVNDDDISVFSVLLKRFCSALLLSASPRPPTQPWNFTFPSCSTCFRFWFKSHLSSGVLPWPSYLKIQPHPSSYYILLPCFIVIEQMISLIIYFVHWAALTLEWRCLEGRHFSLSCSLSVFSGRSVPALNQYRL